MAFSVPTGSGSASAGAYKSNRRRPMISTLSHPSLVSAIRAMAEKKPVMIIAGVGNGTGTGGFTACVAFSTRADDG